MITLELPVCSPCLLQYHVGTFLTEAEAVIERDKMLASLKTDPSRLKPSAATKRRRQQDTHSFVPDEDSDFNTALVTESTLGGAVEVSDSHPRRQRRHSGQRAAKRGRYGEDTDVYEVPDGDDHVEAPLEETFARKRASLPRGAAVDASNRPAGRRSAAAGAGSSSSSLSSCAAEASTMDDSWPLSALLGTLTDPVGYVSLRSTASSRAPPPPPKADSAAGSAASHLVSLSQGAAVPASSAISAPPRAAAAAFGETGIGATGTAAAAPSSLGVSTGAAAAAPSGLGVATSGAGAAIAGATAAKATHLLDKYEGVLRTLQAERARSAAVSAEKEAALQAARDAESSAAAKCDRLKAALDAAWAGRNGDMELAHDLFGEVGAAMEVLRVCTAARKAAEAAVAEVITSHRVTDAEQAWAAVATEVLSASGPVVERRAALARQKAAMAALLAAYEQEEAEWAMLERQARQSTAESAKPSDGPKPAAAAAAVTQKPVAAAPPAGPSAVGAVKSEDNAGAKAAAAPVASSIASVLSATSGAGTAARHEELPAAPDVAAAPSATNGAVKPASVESSPAPGSAASSGAPPVPPTASAAGNSALAGSGAVARGPG